MEKIRILVGSTRRPKLAAVEAAIRDVGSVLAPASAFEVIGAEVESGVGHTPTNRNELMQGARQRAEALIRLPREKAEPAHYFVRPGRRLGHYPRARPTSGIPRELGIRIRWPSRALRPLRQCGDPRGPGSRSPGKWRRIIRRHRSFRRSGRHS